MYMEWHVHKRSYLANAYSKPSKMKISFDCIYLCIHESFSNLNKQTKFFIELSPLCVSTPTTQINCIAQICSKFQLEAILEGI